MKQLRQPFRPRSGTTFGPKVYVEGDSIRASCRSCGFRYGSVCTHVNPSQVIEDIDNTPDWCEMRDAMLRDAREMALSAKPSGKRKKA